MRRSTPAHRLGWSEAAGNGRGPALDLGGQSMWLLPIQLALRIQKTRSGWTIHLRVNLFI